MTKIYLVHSAKTEEAKKLFKKGVKFENLSLRMCTNSIWATKELDEAKQDCRRFNKDKKDIFIYWYEEIDLF